MPSLAQVSGSVQWGWGRNAYRAPITALSGTVKSLCACPPPPWPNRAVTESVWEVCVETNAWPHPTANQNPEGERCSGVREPRVGMEAYGSLEERTVESERYGKGGWSFTRRRYNFNFGVMRYHVAWDTWVHPPVRSGFKLGLCLFLEHNPRHLEDCPVPEFSHL